mgnify:CR=1 FL=1|tara:strand:- start:987 stop:1259 length:273 start_codon:yes stop_codon:yes gene_type:complete
MFKTTDIKCPCGNTKGFYHSAKLAECTGCATAVHVDTPTYHTYNVTPLHEIAKQQALQDIIVMGSFDINGDIADWSNCFDTNNIEQIRVA